MVHGKNRWRTVLADHGSNRDIQAPTCLRQDTFSFFLLLSFSFLLGFQFTFSRLMASRTVDGFRAHAIPAMLLKYQC